MSELQESRISQQAVLMIARNYNKEYVVERVLKRFMKCMQGKQLKGLFITI